MTVRPSSIRSGRSSPRRRGSASSAQEAGVFRLLAPREVGGLELDQVTFLRVVEAASYADGSLGWCVMIGGGYATFAGMLPPPGSHDIFGDPATIAAGAFRPKGVAEEVDGGFRVTGRWPLASGSTHANWYVAGCVVVRDRQPVIGPGGLPLMREVFFPGRTPSSSTRGTRPGCAAPPATTTP